MADAPRPSGPAPRLADAPDRFVELAVRHLDGSLTGPEADELAAMLRDGSVDPAALLMLTLQCSEMRRQNAVQREARDPAQATDAKPRPVVAVPPVAAPSPIKFRNPKTYLPLAAAVLLGAAVVAVYVFVVSEHRPSNLEDRTSPPPIATLIDATHTVSYENDIARAGGEYAPGTYAIESGTAQFVLRSRVTVDLHGPTRLRMHGPMAASLDHGSAAFVVPDDARGYTVHLPHQTRVVDLGTAFSVRVDDGPGGIFVSVTEGLVEFHADDKSTRIAAGQAVRFNADRQLVVIERDSIDGLRTSGGPIEREDVAVYAPLNDRDGLWTRFNSPPEARPAISTSHIDGKPGLRFDTSKGHYLSIADSASTDFTEGGTVAIWVRMDDRAKTAHFVNKVSSDQISEFNFAWTGSNEPKIFLHIGDNSALSRPLRVTAGWHHIAATWQRGGDAVLYFDGREVGRGVVDAPLLHVDADIEIGRGAWAPAADGLAGNLGEVVVLTTALDADAIKNLYESVDPVSDDSHMSTTDGTADQP